LVGANVYSVGRQLSLMLLSCGTFPQFSSPFEAACIDLLCNKLDIQEGGGLEIHFRVRIWFELADPPTRYRDDGSGSKNKKEIQDSLDSNDPISCDGNHPSSNHPSNR